MKTREGYLLIDHQNSPGLPEDVARLSGYDPALAKEGKRFEAGTLTCSHCKSAVVKNPARTRERNYCQKCSGHYICDVCAYKASLPDYSHIPFEKLINIINDKQNKLTIGDKYG